MPTCISTPAKTTCPMTTVWVSSWRISAPLWRGRQHHEGRRTWTSSWMELFGWGRLFTIGNFFSHNSQRDKTGSSGSPHHLYGLYLSMLFIHLKLRCPVWQPLNVSKIKIQFLSHIQHILMAQQRHVATEWTLQAYWMFLLSQSSTGQCC